MRRLVSFALAVALYGYAGWRYLGTARRRGSPVALAMVGAMGGRTVI